MEYSCAADVNESSDEIGIDLDVEDKQVNSQDNEILEVDLEESEEFLEATRTPTGNQYRNIQDEVDAAREGDTILLKGTYYSNGNDTISISKRLIITGDGTAVLDGKQLSTAFNIEEGAAGTIFSNLKFINGNGNLGSAVYVAAKNVKIENCVFEDNHANRAGAIHTKYDLDTASGLIVDNCQFRRNTGYYEGFDKFSAGAALSMYGVDSEVKNSIFEDNWVKGTLESYGGAIQIGMDELGSNGKVTNCIFINNSATSIGEFSHGGAGCIRSGTSYTNCLFIGNSADEGGALTFHGSGEIRNCTFINNTARDFGGALSTGYKYEYMELTVADCNFEGNDAPMGGAVQANGLNILISNSYFKGNNVSENGGAIYAKAENVTIRDSTFNLNKALIDGGAIYIQGKDTLVVNSSFVSNVAIPDVDKLDDGLGGAIYINSSQASVKDSTFRFNTARNGSAIYYDEYGDELTMENNELFQNQAWVYGLPISAEDIYFGDTEEIIVTLFGGNNIADFDNLAVSNAIFNAADNVNILIDRESPIDGATDSGELYQDSREYNINVLLTVLHEDGTIVYNDSGNTSYLGEIILKLDNLKPGKYFVSAKHFEDTYYKAITNVTTFVVSPKVDNEVKKSVSKSVANFEDVVTWTISVRNNGPNDSNNVKLYDVLPDGLIYLSDTSEGRYDYCTGVLTIDELNVNETFTFNITTVINRTGKVVNKVNVTSNEFDTDMTNNYGEEELFVNPACDLAVVKSASKPKPDYKDQITWTIEISNNGPDVAHDVVMYDLLPESLIYLNSEEDYDEKSGIWTVGTLEIGKTATLNIQCIVNSTGAIENFVSVNASEFDYDLTNNNDTETIHVGPASDLAIVKTVNASNVNFNDVVKWILTISNNGPDNATNVRVYDLLPDGFTYVSSTSDYQDDMFTIDNIAVGKTVTVEMITLVQTTGEFMNYANVSSEEYDYDLTNNEDEESILVNSSADLSVTKSVSDSNPSYGEMITWTIEVVNNGPDAAHNVTIRDLLPTSLIWIDDDSLTDYDYLTGVLFISQLDVGESYILNIDCMVNGTGLIQNNVSVSASEYDFNLTNNFANETIDVEKSADVSIIKLANASSPDYHDLVKWTLIISNRGPDKATNVYVEDSLPEGLKLVSYNATKGFYDEGIWVMCCLNMGDVETLEIICRVDKTGEIINLATINADEYDSNQSNNEDNESINVPLAVDIQVVVEVNNTNPFFGENVNWMISVKNNGPDNATGVILEDVLPDELIFSGYELSKGTFEDEIWNIGSLNVGDVAYLNMSTITNALGVIVNEVNAKANEYDWNMSNNYADDLIDVMPVADLSITKLVDNQSPKYGEIIKWTLVALNQGPNAAHNVVVQDILPEGMIFISSDGQYFDGIWDVGSLEVGEEKSLEIISKVALTGNFTNLATISADELDLDESNNHANKSIDVGPASDLSITKIASKYQYYLGDEIEYVIMVFNNGPDTAYNIKATEILDDLLRLNSFEVTKGEFDKLTNVWTIDRLDHGESAELSIKVVAMGSGVLSNNVTVASDTFDYDLSNNDDSAIVEVTEKSPDEGNPPQNDDSDDGPFPDGEDNDNLADDTLGNENSSQNGELSKKPSVNLEMNSTANPILLLLISLILTILFSGAEISKK
ncbi:hypothetical protein [Methanobrevibacter sp.]|uniref:hypothetical protein n=1 Tax=Methanobrevibacter sp. TaxID=66852 RepID=UPI0025D4880C|nr:hypothetical protein [Methanobrevibacter sp.]MBR4448151.1 DUF11 domain-containing protein [Methanobrevibacter sp.]